MRTLPKNWIDALRACNHAARLRELRTAGRARFLTDAEHGEYRRLMGLVGDAVCFVANVRLDRQKEA